MSSIPSIGIDQGGRRSEASGRALSGIDAGIGEGDGAVLRDV
ncbi:MAG: hypothetical protein AB8G23_13545 [Myxococcota bacterium]